MLGRSFPYRNFEEDTQACLQLSRLSLLTKHNQFCSLTSFFCLCPKDICSEAKAEFMPCFERLSRVIVQSNLGNNQKYFNLFPIPSAAWKITPCWFFSTWLFSWAFGRTPKKLLFLIFAFYWKQLLFSDMSWLVSPSV